jgi:hypothetical protein
MRKRIRRPNIIGLTAALAVALLPAISPAQDASKSDPLASELVQLLEKAGLQYIAAKAAEADYYVAALHIPGVQLLAVKAKYSVPVLFDERLSKKEYQDAYIDLNSASLPETKTFIEDLRADGLHVRREGDDPFDIYESAGKRTMFDGDWKKQQLSEQEYTSLFVAADDQYAKMLSALIAQLKKR